MLPPHGKIRKITSYFQKLSSASNERNLHETVPTDFLCFSYKLQISRSQHRMLTCSWQSANPHFKEFNIQQEHGTSAVGTS